MSDELETDEEDFFNTPGIRWAQEHGDDPDKWPLPSGLSLTWQEWARELSAEAMRQGFQPSTRPDLFPWDEDDIRYFAGTCWVEDWLAGKPPREVITRQNR